MLDEPVEAVRERAERLAGLIGGEVEETVARVGGGALPLAELPSAACAIDEGLAAPLRLGDPPVVGIVRDGRLLLDARTLAVDEVDEVGARSSRRAGLCGDSTQSLANRTVHAVGASAVGELVVIHHKRCLAVRCP